MNRIVYTQWYVQMAKSKTPVSNAKHLEYIATRPGVVPNSECGFGLWGRIGSDMQANNIDNLKQAIGLIRKVSKEHTVYRAVVSLDEETALFKGLADRDEWQSLITAHANAIAKENNIELKDFRWCASYHQEKGHPHAHIMFWDNSDKIREEFMGKERFEIAMEKIRASFNADIFREELKVLRTEQDEAKKELRTLSRNQVEGFEHLRFFGDEPPQEESGAVRFYPKGLKQDAAAALSRRLEELVYLLPESGQLDYQYLQPNVKESVDAVSLIVLEQTSLRKARDELLRTVKEISEVHGNSTESVERQIKRAERKIFKDVGNDVLKTIKSLDWLSHRQDVRADELRFDAHMRMMNTADTALNEKMLDPDFLTEYHKLASMLPIFLTPKHEVFKNPAFSDSLRKLTLLCVNDTRLKNETKISQAFETKSKPDSDDETQAAEDENSDNSKKESEEFKAVYRYISQKLYDTLTHEKGWDMQAACLKANNFLRVFCKLTSPHNCLNNSTNRFLLLRELSKQAKKEKALVARDSSKMWQI